ncbi:TPA: site-specific DNA-methyltransferase [Escherichia coli]|uniref:site-specific DNA-methyltransferase n=1 Tax=Escherichia coli TaxID=562 RepID=UPI0017E4D874|nr:site-specific DNA-methyltransferase [Escherichia coli]EFM2237611.1 site-specific DNA-methyltransferase [Escherichia coli]ELK4991135.1 site-specific DNA-methyltransferase [Escherichia coli]UUD34413.1 site-specific DNA-methyltransferase [Escherichia coli]WCP56236.1 site-specific DNA-methyltransferase [Escherichia coli]HAJ3997975.1 site-specific DNA-methyltransferase [Escherichia coli]
MDKLKMHSPDMTQQNIEKIQAFFPNCVTESKGANGELKLAIDFDQLKQELSNSIVEGPQERYQLNWPGKREALLTANAPIAKTLRPCREESVNFDTTENLFIEGDNLDALKMLQETYLGKVKMIYIDPPYNTGNDFIYNDDFSESNDLFLKRSNQVDSEGNRLVANRDTNGRFHSDWLTMMYSRLKLARNLLSDDGVIFIHIDDNELDSLGKICSEIFGEQNFINVITVKTKIGGVSGSSEGKSLKDATEFIWVYSKNKESTLLNPVYIKTKLSDRIKSYEEDGKSWKYTSIVTKLDDKVLIKEDTVKKVKYYGYKTLETKSIQTFARENNISEEQVYNLYADKIFQTTNAQSSVRATAMREMQGQNYPMYGCEYAPIKGKNQGKTIEVLYKGEQLRMMMFLSDAVEKVDNTYYYMDRITTLWDDIEYNNLTKEGDTEFSNGKKPVKLLQRLVSLSTDKSSIVLDFFAGSGSTAHSVMAINAEDGGNRKFIMVQLAEECDKKSEAFKAGYKTIAEISKERIRRAGAKILEGECHQDWNKDVGFRVLKVDTSNMADVYYSPDQLGQVDLLAQIENIKPDRTDEDLLFQVLLDWGVDLTLPIRKETIQGKTVFFVDDDALVACFDLRINEALIKELATKEPLRVVFRDGGFESDAVKINAEQIFKQVSPHTEVKAI